MNDLQSHLSNWRPLDTASTKPSLQPKAMKNASVAAGSASFQDALSAATDRQAATWNVSLHAQQRLTSRGIQLTKGDFQAMDTAASQAESKGARNAYMILGQTGLVVNLPSRTVVTAMENHSHTVVTQIDSVVIVQ